MANTDISVSKEIGEALGWARRAFAYQETKIVTDYPWAKTVELKSATSRAFLKVATPPAGCKSLALISEYLSPNVPPLMTGDQERGLFLYADHRGEPVGRKLDAATKLSIMTTYAAVQRKALGHHDLIASLPQIQLDRIYDEFLQFLTPGGDDTPKLDGTVGAAHFLGRGSAQKYFDIFSAAEPLFRKFLARGAGLQPAINHCNLRPSNIARRKDGAIVIFDWDDALAGPPGLSLHSLFSGCCRPFAALAGISGAPKAERRESDRELLHAYVDQLCGDGAFDAKVVIPALPAIICAGVLNYLLAFGSYPVPDSSSRETIGKNMRRRFSDLMDVAQLLARDDRDAARNLADAFRSTGRESRAGQVLETSQSQSDAKLTKKAHSPARSFEEAIEYSYQPGVFPALDISDEEQTAGSISPANRKLGFALFERHGTLMVRNAIPREIIARCHSEFMANYGTYLRDTKNADTLRGGDERCMVTTKFSGTFADPMVFASPFVLPILKKVLGKQAILGSMTSVLSLPGSADQQMHKDNSALFVEAPELVVPSFSVAMIVPLVALNQVNGATRVVKGSHRRTSDEVKTMPHQDPEVELGSCLLMDCRLSHQEMANNSDQPSPILNLVYQRPWYRDYQSFQKQVPLTMDDDGLDRVPDELKHLVDWV